MRKNLMADELPHSMTSILESKLKILCDFCNKQVNQPKICPACNQIFCLACLTKHHETYKNCPMCHEKLTMVQFLDCDCHKFIEYFRHQLGRLQYSSKISDSKHMPYQSHSPNFKEFQQQEKCQLHEIPLKYFCETCSKPICSDCGMMAQQHKDHKFTRINDIYTKIKQKLNIQLDNLTKKILTYQQNSLVTKKKLQKLQIQYMHIKRYTEEYYLLLVEKFEQEIDAKSGCLKEIQDKNNKDIEFYELCRDGICEEIERKSRNELIGETEKLLSSFTINTCEPCEPLKFEQSFETIKQLMPQYNNFEYTLKNFSHQTSSIVYSDPFTINGVEWRLKIYPKGNGVAKGKYLSVFVEMSKAERNQKKYEYKIELVNYDTSAQNIRREYCSAFDIGECWGYNQFVLLEELEQGFMFGDSLQFVMGIRNSDYRSLSQDQSTYIARLQASVKKRQNELQNQISETNIIDDLDRPSCGNHSNETKFLKFLESSPNLHEQKTNQNKMKERVSNHQKKIQQKKQSKIYITQNKEEPKFNKKQQEKRQNSKLYSQKKSEERTTNNLQRTHIKASGEKLYLQNQFSLAQEGFLSQQENQLKFNQSQQRIRNKEEDIQRTKKKKLSQQEKTDLKQKNHQSPGNKFISLKELKSEKFSSNNDSKNSILIEMKPQRKERNFLIKQEQHEQKNYVGFNESKRHPKKQEINDFESSKKIKKQTKDTKNLMDFCPYQKIEQQKIPKSYLKYEEPRERIGMKQNKNSGDSPGQRKYLLDENETRKKQISSILQQSKKLQGLSETSKNCFSENKQGIKQSGISQSVLKTPIKPQLRFQQQEEKKKSERKFSEDDDF